MKKHILLIINILAIAFNANAQTAETILKAAVDKLKSYENFGIEFDYNMINAEAGIYETMDSNTVVLQGDAYRMVIMNQEIICDGTTIWIYTPDNEEVMISDASEDNSGNPFNMIESYYENVTTKFVGESDGNIKKIEAISISSEDNFSSMILTINVNTLEIKEIHIFDSNGNEFACIINKFVTNQKLPVDFFTFKESDYPDVEIIDMR